MTGVQSAPVNLNPLNSRDNDRMTAVTGNPDNPEANNKKRKCEAKMIKKKLNHKNYYNDLISSVDIEDLAREHLNITVEETGKLYCDCPNHSSQSSKSLHIDTDSQLWNCFGCGVGGNAIHLQEFISHGVVSKGMNEKMPLSHREARDTLAKKVGMPMLGKEISEEKEVNLAEAWNNNSRTYGCLTLAAQYYHLRLRADEEIFDWILQKYGFQEETVDRFKIGYAINYCNGRSIEESLTEKGYSKEEILSTGLFSKGSDGKLLPFFNNRLTFPYWRKGQGVTYMIGRRTPWTPDNRYEDQKYKKLQTYNKEKRPYVNPCVQNQGLFNEDCLRERPQRVIMPEGISDVISAIETGEAAVSPVTVRIKKDDRREIADKLIHIDVPVIIVPDNEVSQVGLNGSIDTANFLLGEGIDARIAMLDLDNRQTQARKTLKDKFGITEGNDQLFAGQTEAQNKGIRDLLKDAKTDLNEYLKTHSKEDFQAIIEAAQSPISLNIDKICPDLSGHELKTALKPVFEGISKLDAVQQDEYLKVLKSKLNMPMTTLRKRLKEVALEYQDDGDKESSFSKLLEIFSQLNGKAFLDQHGTGWVTLPVDGHWENIRIESSTFKKNILGLYVNQQGEPIGKETISIFGDYLESQATHRRSLYNRFAWEDNKLYIDLGNPKWECVEVTEEGWSITAPKRPPFKRFSHQKPLPKPEKGGDVKKILEYLPLKDWDAQILYLVWLITYCMEGCPRPGIILHGLQGSGKSTVAELTRLIIDPSSVLTLSLSKDVGEFVQLMDHHALVNLDNLNSLPQWASDSLCRAVTGSGFQKRSLYTNDEDFTYEFRRSFILNGIGCPATAADLLDRAMIIQLDRIPKKERAEIEDLMERFEKDRPSILGGIFDAISKAMKIRPNITLKELPRMADWFLWACAVAEAIDIPQERFEKAYYENIGLQHQEVIQSEPVAEMLLEFMEDRMSWNGSKGQLYEELTKIAEERKISKKQWPKSTSPFMKRLKKISHNLEEEGFKIEESRDKRERNIKIMKTNLKEHSSGANENEIHPSAYTASGNAVTRVTKSSNSDNIDLEVTPLMTGEPESTDSPVMDSKDGLPEDTKDWPESWTEELLTLSGHINDGNTMSWEEADRIAESQLRKRYARENQVH